jgi:ubiquinone/menaquinone biosynthesis C-methylase UbiE
MKTFLHVGCGLDHKSELIGFNNDGWKEIRFDIDELVNPDIVGTLLDMSKVQTGSVDAVYSSHNIEHVYPHEVPIVLKEFYRVLKDDGIVVLHCPDLQSVCEAVADNKLLETLYETEDGHKISAIDILYGWRVAISNGNEYMAHKGGFTYSVLNDSFLQAGFKMNYGGRVSGMNLFIVSSKQLLSEDELVKIGKPFFPKP